MARTSSTPPLFDLADPAFRIEPRADGLHIERRFRWRTLTMPLLAGTVMALVVWSAWIDGTYWVVGVMGVGLALWVVYMLIRIRSDDSLHIASDHVTWRQRWPRAFAGSWSGPAEGVRLVYDRPPRWHDDLHVQVDIQHGTAWIQIAFATTLGMAPARRRAERLADTIGETLGRPVERVVHSEDGPSTPTP